MVLFKYMVKRVLLPFLVVMLLVVACTSATPPIPTERPATATVQDILILPTSTSEPEKIEQEAPTLVNTDVVETLEAVCPGESTNTIGQGIADEYEFSSYEEVMSWFCDGAEFEDILVALQTEDQTDIPTEELLEMLAEGLSWEDIWLVFDLME